MLPASATRKKRRRPKKAAQGPVVIGVCAMEKKAWRQLRSQTRSEGGHLSHACVRGADRVAGYERHPESPHRLRARRIHGARALLAQKAAAPLSAAPQSEGWREGASATAPAASVSARRGQVIIFSDDMILNQPIDRWPVVARPGRSLARVASLSAGPRSLSRRTACSPSSRTASRSPRRRRTWRW